MLNRRALLRYAGSALVLSAASGLPARAEMRKVKVQLPWLPNASFAGEIVALRKGFFAEKGLDVELLPGGPSANPSQDLVGGTVDIAIGYAPEIMYGSSRGLPLRSFAAAFQKAPLTYYSLGEANIKSVADWKGKRVGGAPSGIPQVKALLRHAGLTFEDITYVQAQVPALMQDQVDVIGTWPTNVAQNQPILTHPGGYNTQSIWDNGLQFQSNYYIARTDTLDKDQAMLVAFLEACDMGWAWAADHPDEAINEVVAYAPALEADKELASLKVTVDYIYTDETRENGFGYLSADRWQQTLDTYIAIGELPDGMTSDQVMDGRILAASARTKR
jgi:NitT/TauT family transport system substrate-binding protein